MLAFSCHARARATNCYFHGQDMGWHEQEIVAHPGMLFTGLPAISASQTTWSCGRPVNICAASTTSGYFGRESSFTDVHTEVSYEVLSDCVALWLCLIVRPHHRWYCQSRGGHRSLSSAPLFSVRGASSP